MLITPRSLKKLFRICPSAIIHVGAHEAEEVFDYDKYFSANVIWIEAQPELVSKLQRKFQDTKHQVVEAAIWEASGIKLKFKNTSNSQSSSLLSLGTHSQHYPTIKALDEIEVVTKTLDDVIPTTFQVDFINLDIQGTELSALKGFANRLDSVKWIYSEVNREEVYQNCSLVTDMDSFLRLHNFHRIETRWHFGRGWGDALYVKSESVFMTILWKTVGFLHSTPWHLIEIAKYSIRPVLRFRLRGTKEGIRP